MSMKNGDYKQKMAWLQSDVVIVDYVGLQFTV